MKDEKEVIRYWRDIEVKAITWGITFVVILLGWCISQGDKFEPWWTTDADLAYGRRSIFLLTCQSIISVAWVGFIGRIHWKHLLDEDKVDSTVPSFWGVIAFTSSIAIAAFIFSVLVCAT
ncbi:hypothetical protein OT109_13590 [Phycisphaeraceae bacterium D3-23]